MSARTGQLVQHSCEILSRGGSHIGHTLELLHKSLQIQVCNSLIISTNGIMAPCQPNCAVLRQLIAIPHGPEHPGMFAREYQ